MVVLVFVLGTNKKGRRRRSAATENQNQKIKISQPKAASAGLLLQKQVDPPAPPAVPFSFATCDSALCDLTDLRLRYVHVQAPP